MSLWVESPDKSLTLKSVLKDPETDCLAVAKSSLPVYPADEQGPIKDQLLVGEMDSKPQRIHFNNIDKKIIHLDLVDL